MVLSLLLPSPSLPPSFARPPSHSLPTERRLNKAHWLQPVMHSKTEESASGVTW